MKISVIISHYKALDNLKLILEGLQNQSDMRFEAIISEDDSNPETVDFIQNHSTDYAFSIVHVNQKEDLGFRKTMMLNKSIRVSSTKFLVFIDGDCIPAKHFVQEYIRNAADGFIFWGRRVMLGKKYTQRIKEKKSTKGINLLSLLLSDSTKVKEAIYSPAIKLAYKTRGLVGCNWGIMKKHLVDINGYDEDYILPVAGEDNDIEWRLEANGIVKQSIKNKAIVYHMYHPRSYSNEGIQINTKILLDKMEKGIVRCLNGLEKLNQPSTND